MIVKDILLNYCKILNNTLGMIKLTVISEKKVWQLTAYLSIYLEKIRSAGA